MKEVVDISKNFNTGEVITKTKLKPNNGLMGKVTIELGNEENVMEQTLSHNYIKNIVEHQRYAWESSTDYLGYSNSSNYSGYFYPFGTIVMTDYAGEENTTDKFIRGSVVGWCPQSDVTPGSYPKRGKYNVDESYTTITDDGYYHYHWVYDFSEAQGNGDINSVYWIPKGATSHQAGKVTTNLFQDMYNISYPSGLPLEGLSNTASVSYNSTYFDYDGTLCTPYNFNNEGNYYRRISNWIYALNLYGTSKCVITREKTSFGTEQMITGIAACTCSVECTGGAIANRTGVLTMKYYPDVNLESFEESSIDFAQLPNVKKYLDLYTGTSSSYGKVYPYIQARDNDGNLYISVDIYPESTPSRLPKVNEDGTLVEGSHARWVYLCIYNVITKKWILPLNLEDYRCYYNYAANSISTSTSTNNNWTKSSYVVSQNNAGVFVADINSDGALAYRTENGIPIIENDFFINGSCKSYSKFLDVSFKTPSNYMIVSKFRGMIGAHTKLPKTITKTSDVPMKVKYDIYIQLANRFAAEGHEFEFN